MKSTHNSPHLPIVSRVTWHVSRPESFRGFTLIELLVVIVVIMTLAGLLMPAVQRASDSAKRSRTQTMIGNIEMALKLYYNEYGRLPNKASSPYSADALLDPTENMRLYWILTGADCSVDATTAGYNPRKVSFLTLKTTDVGLVNATTYVKDTTTTITNIVNPWGNSFRVVMDYDGDGTAAVAPATNRSECAIWTVGGEGSMNNAYTNVSWK